MNTSPYAIAIIKLSLVVVTLSNKVTALAGVDYYTPAPLPLTVSPQQDGNSKVIANTEKALGLLRDFSIESEQIWLEIVNCNGAKACKENDKGCWQGSAEKARENYFKIPSQVCPSDQNASQDIELKIKNLKIQIDNMLLTDMDLSSEDAHRYINQSGAYLSPLLLQFLLEKIIRVAEIKTELKYPHEYTHVEWPKYWSDEEISSHRHALEVFLLIEKEACVQWGLWPRATAGAIRTYQFGIDPGNDLVAVERKYQDSSNFAKFGMQVMDIFFVRKNRDYFKKFRFSSQTNLSKMAELSQVAVNAVRGFENYVSCGRSPDTGNFMSYFIKIKKAAR